MWIFQKKELKLNPLNVFPCIICFKLNQVLWLLLEFLKNIFQCSFCQPFVVEQLQINCMGRSELRFLGHLSITRKKRLDQLELLNEIVFNKAILINVDQSYFLTGACTFLEMMCHCCLKFNRICFDHHFAYFTSEYIWYDFPVGIFFQTTNYVVHFKILIRFAWNNDHKLSFVVIFGNRLNIQRLKIFMRRISAFLFF